jgi:membrane protease YdiL (CAAX protease family)
MSTLVPTLAPLAQALAQVGGPPTPVTQPADEPGAAALIQVAVLLAMLTVAFGVALGPLRVYRPSKVAGPERLPAGYSVAPLLMALGMAIFALLAVAGAYAKWMVVRGTAGGGVSSADQIIASAVTPVAALLAGWGLLWLVQPGSVRALGFGPSNLPQGLRLGLLAAVVAVPLTFLTSVITQQVYQATGVEHPNEHDLLKAMKAVPPFVQWLGVLAAVVVAPVVEEFMFRGLLQTALTEWLVRLGRPSQFVPEPMPLAPRGAGTEAAGVPAPPSSMPPSPAPTHVQPLDYEVPAASTPEEVVRRRYPRAWAAILATSVLFALVHPLWMFPIIFFLSLCLGYAYERTGNLWTSIALHALFNGVSTAVYLSGASG